jgi:hypothetical protein
VITSDDQLAALIERGALVDLDELQTPRERARHAPRGRCRGCGTTACRV